jgi:glycosyltransferase involved in cell wall biosynthesis
LRVLHLVACPTLTGAAEPAWDLVRGLRALGEEVELRIDTRRTGNLRGILEAAGEVVADDLVLSTKGGAVDALRDWACLSRLLPRFDVVHTHLSHDHALAALASPRRGGPTLVRTVHAARALEPSRARRWVLRRAAGLTVACEAHRALLVERHRLPAERVLVLPGAVDTARFFPDVEARGRVRAELGLEGRFAIGCVARFQAGRRHEVLLEALAEARAERPELALVLIGHGETEAALRARAQAPDLAGAVLFPGYKRADLNDYLNGLDAAAWMVNGNDATSRAVLQAMAVGLPVLGGRIDAIAEAVREGQTGLLADPDDPGGVAAAMVALASDPEQARRMGARGLELARGRYTFAARAAAALDFYARLVGEVRGPA